MTNGFWVIQLLSVVLCKDRQKYVTFEGRDKGGLRRPDVTLSVHNLKKHAWRNLWTTLLEGPEMRDKGRLKQKKIACRFLNTNLRILLQFH